jgi:hypothetical protein
MRRAPGISRVTAAGLLALALAACVVGGYGDGYEEGYVGEVYEPGGYVYGGWDPGYRVGPPRRDERGPRERPAPSIPHGARGGGHAGGGRRH